MSDYIEVYAVVEGRSEQIFVEKLLAPYLAEKQIYIQATQVSKPGQKGGDVRFSRAINDIEGFLKQRPDTYVTTLVDYYGIKEWPGLENVPKRQSPSIIAAHLNQATKAEVIGKFSAQQAEQRFIPYMAMHEFEALLFSDSAILADELGIAEEQVRRVLAECGEPEAINNGPTTAPSKRLDGWSPKGEFAKTTKGIAIAERIGIPQMRAQCPLFDGWLGELEALVG